MKWKPEKGVQAIFAIVSFFRRSVFDLIVVPVKGLLGDETLQSEGEENTLTANLVYFGICDLQDFKLVFL